jgi:Domain of unknown function (DUF5710)
MERVYLYVAPEEYAEVRALGASWDGDSKRWYIRSDVAPAPFARWLENDEQEAQFGIVSDEAFVASTRTACVTCQGDIEVICIYCESGTDVEMDEAMARFTVSGIWAMDDALAAQLERWPLFKREVGAGSEEECFANHCSHCGAVQEDYRLHSEPEDVFFCASDAEPGTIKFIPLVGRVHLSGNYGFRL